ncbi:MAG TPA: sialidase family protein [Blastocatellia bacterium]|nr:sialidase family protein [Blastocatellia bacterium]
MRRLLLSLWVVVAASSVNTVALGQVQASDPPASAGSSVPNLFTAPDGRVYLSWIETSAEKRHALRFSVLSRRGWSAPQTIASGDNWFVNWADFPSIVALADGSLAAHWLEKNGEGTYAYDVRISRSFDKGKTWTGPATPHSDRTQTEHGFVSMLGAGSRLMIAWLDGRKFKPQAEEHSGHDHGPSDNEMTQRFAEMAGGNRFEREAELDARVCECCQTSAAMTSDGMVVVYRDRSKEEVRDISVVRYSRGRWSEPKPVYRDNWKIDGCPVNGPSVSATGGRVAVAWFTATGDRPSVKVAFSNDAAATFGQPIQVDDSAPLGRVDILMLKDGSAIVTWLERTEKGAEIRARKVAGDGSLRPSVTVAESNAARASGFPQSALFGQGVVFAWTETGSPSRLRGAIVNLARFK